MKSILEYINESKTTEIQNKIDITDSVSQKLRKDGFSDNEIMALKFICLYSSTNNSTFDMFDGSTKDVFTVRNRDIDYSGYPFTSSRQISGYLSSVKKRATKMKCPYLSYWKSTTKECGLPYWACEEWAFDEKVFKPWFK